MICLQLFIEFFKIGLFSFGGGYATIPFLYHISEIYEWYTFDELTHMIAVACVTPGPVGINVATYAGIKTAGIFGAMLSTTAEMLPSLIIVILVSKVLKKFSDNFYVKAALDSLKPISCALLTFVVIGLITPEIHSLKSMFLLTVLILLSWNGKKDPVFYLSLSALAGLLVKII